MEEGIYHGPSVDHNLKYCVILNKNLFDWEIFDKTYKKLQNKNKSCHEADKPCPPNWAKNHYGFRKLIYPGKGYACTCNDDKSLEEFGKELYNIRNWVVDKCKDRIESFLMSRLNGKNTCGFAGQICILNSHKLPVSNYTKFKNSLLDKSQMSCQDAWIATAEIMYGFMKASNNDWRKNIIIDVAKEHDPPLMFPVGTKRFGMINNLLSEHHQKECVSMNNILMQNYDVMIMKKNPSKIGSRKMTKIIKKVLRYSGGVVYVMQVKKRTEPGNHPVSLETAMTELVCQHGKEVVLEAAKKVPDTQLPKTVVASVSGTEEESSLTNATIASRGEVGSNVSGMFSHKKVLAHC